MTESQEPPALDAPTQAHLRRSSVAAAPATSAPTRARHQSGMPRTDPTSEPGTPTWRSPGLCEDGANAASLLERRRALWRSFATTQVHEVRIWSDRAVPAPLMTEVAFAIDRTRQYASYLFGWSPREAFPPPIYLYRDVEQMRSIACVNGSRIAYYDGSVHIAGDSRFTEATIRQAASHEYVHHILVTIGVERPFWLHEGLAMQIAEERWWRKPGLGLQEWLARKHFPFDALVDLVPQVDKDESAANAAYYQSYMMVRFIAQRRGDRYFRDLLDDLAWARMSPEDAFARGAAEPPLAPAALEEEWRRFVDASNERAH
jgi:hypothetical protein